VTDLRSYLAESHLPRIRRSELQDAASRARVAAEELASEGWRVRHLHTTFVPEDEMCLHVFEASSIDAVNEAMRRAALAADRIVEAVE
jgi:Nickel responsive protein SCO4226-like